MQKILGLMRRAISEYNLIDQGDRVAVGVSGGKDSMVMLKGLCELRGFLGANFSLVAISLDLCVEGRQTDYAPLQALCDGYCVPLIIKRTDLWEIIFERRKEKNPCSLCARMRRGMLHDIAKAEGCNKVALGHHMNDAVETFFMNLFNEGRLGCFQPKSYLSRKDLTMVRPLVLAEEPVIASAAERNALPIIKSLCPADKKTNREAIKAFIAERETIDPGFARRTFGALRRSGLDGW